MQPTPPHNESGISRRRFLRNSLGALAAPLFVSCGNYTAGADTIPRLSARPGPPSIEPTRGFSTLEIGKRRNGTLYVPESYSPETPAPLFVALHGGGGAGIDWTSYYVWAEERGMILLAPDSRGSTWDLVWDGFGPDVPFLDRALTYTFDRCNIDPNHIALGGFSDGASYALSLGVSNGDLFSHLIAYSPGFFEPSEPYVGKPKIFVAHGNQDSVLPVTRSRNKFVPSLRDAGYDVSYSEFDGGHELPPAITHSALDWFLEGR